jgi:hypothetical protein
MHPQDGGDDSYQGGDAAEEVPAAAGAVGIFSFLVEDNVALQKAIAEGAQGPACVGSGSFGEGTCLKQPVCSSSQGDPRPSSTQKRPAPLLLLLPRRPAPLFLQERPAPLLLPAPSSAQRSAAHILTRMVLPTVYRIQVIKDVEGGTHSGPFAVKVPKKTK